MDILFCDEHLVAVNKPAGLLVHRSNIDKRETRFAMQLLRDHLGRRVYPVHRLDKAVSGVLLFALSADAARRMNTIVTGAGFEKTYLAIVRGYTEAQGVIDYPLAEQHDKMTDARARRDKAAQAAVTRYATLATRELPFAVGRYPTARYSLVRLSPTTGRKHQLRRHMKHIFHPIIGDTTHGDGRHNRFFREHFHVYRLMLSATRLSFDHPYDDTRVELAAPLDAQFRSALAQLGWESDGVEAA